VKREKVSVRPGCGMRDCHPDLTIGAMKSREQRLDYGCDNRELRFIISF
jgi:hypothetical protein